MTARPEQFPATQESAFTTGGVLLLLNVGLGAILGFVVGAAETQVTSDGGAFGKTVTVTELTITTTADKGFNWLIFVVFLAVGLVSFAVCYAAAANAVRVRYFMALALFELRGEEDDDPEDDDAY